MRARTLSRLALAVFLLALAPPAAAQTAEVCSVAPSGPVSLIVLESGAKVRALAASLHDVTVLRRDAETVIFDDGRVITADVAAAGDHLNALGWGNRSIRFVASFPRRAKRPTRRFG